MSISIKNLYYDTRDVGKTIKGTKKYFVWEFVLNGKYHKVEMFHSKMSGKKKLCVDAQAVAEEKSYKNDFTYSFKIDKNYFNCIQLNNDRYELRIDNRAFEILMQEERTGRLKEDTTNQIINKTKSTDSNDYDNVNMNKFSKFEAMPNNLKRGSVSNISNNPRNSGGDDFFNDNDFDFNNGSNSKSSSFNNRGSFGAPQNRNENNINSFANFNDFTNKFSNPKSVNNNRSNVTANKADNKNTLIDVNDIFSEKSKQPTTSTALNSKDVLNQINFDLSSGDNGNVNNNHRKSTNMDVFHHNQNVLNNISLPEDEPEPNFSQHNNADNFQKGGNMGLFDQENFSQGGFMNNTNTQTNQVSSNNNMINDFFLNPNSTNNNPSSSNNFNNLSNNNQADNTSKSDNMNDFKKNILTSGLVNIDNLLDDRKKSNTSTNLNVNYNFGFNSGGMPLNYMDTSMKSNVGMGGGMNYPMNTGMNYNMNNNYYQMNMGMGYGMNQNMNMQNMNQNMNYNINQNMNYNLNANMNSYSMNNNPQMNRKSSSTPFDY